MKKIAILCQTAPGGKRRLAEEALRLATGLTARALKTIDKNGAYATLKRAGLV